MNKQVLSIWGCVEAVSDEEVERCVCVCVRVRRAADRSCSSLPQCEQIVEFRETWELLNSCLIRGA